MTLLEELAARNRFGMKPGLAAMRAACAVCGHPEESLGKVVHVAGTNGKGAVCAMLDACLGAKSQRVARYTSPHLVALNERFSLAGKPIPLAQLDAVVASLPRDAPMLSPLTYFEFLTLVAFQLYAAEKPDWTILETGLGGRLDATNVCTPALTIITRVGLDHCNYLGDTVAKIAAEKAGIIKPGVPVVLGANAVAVREVVAARARDVGAPFFFAPELADESEIPASFSLTGRFNRENAVTVIAALKVLSMHALCSTPLEEQLSSLSQVVWPGRFQRVGDCLIDGAHNPPAAHALFDALVEIGVAPKSLTLICGFCGDKDVDEVLRILSPLAARAFAVRTNNARSLSADVVAQKLTALGVPTVACATLALALHDAGLPAASCQKMPSRLICGSLFLAGEALAALGVPSFVASCVDPAERLLPS